MTSLHCLSCCPSTPSSLRPTPPPIHPTASQASWLRRPLTPCGSGARRPPTSPRFSLTAVGHASSLWPPPLWRHVSTASPSPGPAAVSCYLCNPGWSLSAPSSLSLLSLLHPWQHPQRRRPFSATPPWQRSLDDEGMEAGGGGGALCLSGVVRVGEK